MTDELGQTSDSVTLAVTYTPEPGSVRIGRVREFPDAHYHENTDGTITWHPSSEARCDLCRTALGSDIGSSNA